MKVNGKDLNPVSPMTVEDLVLSTGRVPDRVAVELNGKIVPRAEYPRILLKEDDSVEIVGFVGGG
ncbi:MAG: sulfur carrier protein ThiS [Candidatus Methanoplasma sp.]|jgi:sulfur carrier protein|nr:sulfur carrier protein ThiS [Candidatus Methanoplasma sp.]